MSVLCPQLLTSFRLCWQFASQKNLEPKISHSKIPKTISFANISPTVLKKWSFKGKNKNTTILWCLNLFQSYFCFLFLRRFYSLGSSMCIVCFKDKKYCTLSYPKLTLLLLSRQRLLGSESWKEITQNQIVPDVWTCFSQCCVFAICGTRVYWVRCCAPCANRTRKIVL